MFTYQKALQYPVKIATPTPGWPPSSSASTAAPTGSWRLHALPIPALRHAPIPRFPPYSPISVPKGSR